jgi:transcriptional regulator with XRE-family HTH domain
MDSCTMLARNLKRMRKMRGWTQEDLARQAGVGRITIAQLETCAVSGPRGTTLDRLATALEMPIAAFYLPEP